MGPSGAGKTSVALLAAEAAGMRPLPLSHIDSRFDAGPSAAGPGADEAAIAADAIGGVAFSAPLTLIRGAAAPAAGPAPPRAIVIDAVDTTSNPEAIVAAIGQVMRKVTDALSASVAAPELPTVKAAAAACKHARAAAAAKLPAAATRAPPPSRFAVVLTATAGEDADALMRKLAPLAAEGGVHLVTLKHMDAFSMQEVAQRAMQESGSRLGDGAVKAAIAEARGNVRALVTRIRCAASGATSLLADAVDGGLAHGAALASALLIPPTSVSADPVKVKEHCERVAAGFDASDVPFLHEAAAAAGAVREGGIAVTSRVEDAVSHQDVLAERHEATEWLVGMVGGLGSSLPAVTNPAAVGRLAYQHTHSAWDVMRMGGAADERGRAAQRRAEDIATSDGSGGRRVRPRVEGTRVAPADLDLGRATETWPASASLPSRSTSALEAVWVERAVAGGVPIPTS